MIAHTPTTRRIGAVHALALAVAAALCAVACGSAIAAPDAAFVTLAHATALRGGDAVLGALPMNQSIHVEVALKLRNPDVLDAFVASGARPAMTGAAFLALHAPTQAQAQAVADYLIGMGLRNVRIAPNRLLVSADGTALSAGNAFKTSFAQVRTSDGRIAFANTREARIPAALGDSVLAVLGLQTVHIAQPFAQRFVAAATQAHADAATSHDPLALAAFDGGATLAAAANVTVGIVTAGALAQTQADLARFTATHHLPAVNTQTVATGAGSTDTSHTDAWNLASQGIVGMAGGRVGQLIFYNLPDRSSASLLAGLHMIVAANQARVIDLAMGLCERDALDDGSAAADDAVFEAAVAQGQTFAVATGDRGADACGDGSNAPGWPAASRYVVAVAGTRLSGANAWLDETLWPGSGGSPSRFEPLAPWQAGFAPAGMTTRSGADVALDADPQSGAQLVLNGSRAQYGGTGLSSSLFTGAWARVLQQHPGIGFAGPVLYALPAADFHDITRGSNGAQSARSGFDPASGRGSLVLERLLADAPLLANQPPVADFSFTSTERVAHFTDASTDADGKIASHGWDFGDGGTSTIGNPNHTYATTGTYNVTETVTDNKGAPASKTKPVVIAIPPPLQLLKNTGFESGQAHPWKYIGTGPFMHEDSSHAHAGSWFAELGHGGCCGRGGHRDVAGQTITIPSGYKSATLTFYLNIINAGSGKETYLNVLYNNCEGSSCPTPSYGSSLLLQVKAEKAPKGYRLYSVDMSGFIGDTLSLELVGENLQPDSPFFFDVDDVTLTLK